MLITKLNNNSIFHAAWHEQLRYDDRALWVIARKIKNFIFYIPNSMLATIFNPRHETKSDNLLRTPLSFNNRVLAERRITTPDNVHLKIKIEIPSDSTTETPTVILFNPLATNYGFHSELTSKLIEKKCIVIRFDYRGLGSTWREEDFVVDGDSVYQYATKQLNINPNKVHFFGTSFGGAVAAQVKSLHPDSGKYVGDRPFKSVFSFITEFMCISRFGAIIKKITSFVSAVFLAYPVIFLGWKFDGTKAQLGSEKRGIYHPNDCLIPAEASLAIQFEEEQRICLDSSITGAETHFYPIEHHKVDHSEDAAIDIIADFLVS